MVICFAGVVVVPGWHGPAPIFAQNTSPFGYCWTDWVVSDVCVLSCLLTSVHPQRIWCNCVPVTVSRPSSTRPKILCISLFAPRRPPRLTLSDPVCDTQVVLTTLQSRPGVLFMTDHRSAVWLPLPAHTLRSRPRFLFTPFARIYLATDQRPVI